MNTSTGTSLSVFNSASENFILERTPRQRRRSNSSNDILAHVSVKAIRSPRRDASYNNIPRPPRLAYDTSSQAFAPIMPRTPPSRQEYIKYDYGPPPQTHLLYKNELNLPYKGGSSSSRGSRATSFGSNTSGSSRLSLSSQQVPSSLSAFYNERIEKTTSFDDEDSAGEETMSRHSSVFDELDNNNNNNNNNNNTFNVDSSLVQEVFLLRKEIDAVKNSLSGLQKNRVDTLNEKKQLEQQYQEAKSDVKRTLEFSTNDLLSFNELLDAKVQKLSLELSASNSDFTSDDNNNNNNNDDLLPEYEVIMNDCVHLAKELELSQSQLEKSKQDFRDLLNVKEKIEISFEAQEREYCERIRQFEAVISGQSGMIDQMETVLRDAEGKMDKLINEKIKQQQAAAAAAAAAAASQQQNHQSQQSNQKRDLTSRSHNHCSHHSRSSQSFLTDQRRKSSISSITPREHTHSRSHSKQKQSISGSTINATGSAGSTGSNSHDGKSNRLQDITRSINHLEQYHSSELMPSYCLSPPQTRIQSCANPALLFTDEERVRHQTRFSLAKRWVEDDEVSECQRAGCLIKFNWWNRRHHCRRCGNIFCSTHSAFSMLLFPDGSEDWGGVWSRVCEGCFRNT